LSGPSRHVERSMISSPYHHQAAGPRMTIDALSGLRGLLLGNRLVDDAHVVGLLHDQEFLAVDLDLGARPIAEEHAITLFDIDRNEFAGFVHRDQRDHLALRRFFLGGVWDDDAAGGFLLDLDTPDDDAVVKKPLVLAVDSNVLVYPLMLTRNFMVNSGF